jgi:phosphoglycolate phosphatase
VIWDWNGTLYDDVGWCVEVVNAMLARRGLPRLDGVEAYRRVFGFPVIDYYRRVGFDLDAEAFEALAEEYMAHYHGGTAGRCGLYKDAGRVLQTLRRRGLRQVVLSASRNDHLRAQVDACGVGGTFERMLGVSDIYAAGKAKLAHAYIAEAGSTGRAVLVGDSTHDYEVAAALKIDCLLVAHGHQSRRRLSACGVPVLDGISDVLSYINDCEN